MGQMKKLAEEVNLLLYGDVDIRPAVMKLTVLEAKVLLKKPLDDVEAEWLEENGVTPEDSMGKECLSDSISG